jgi:hypothetical protein
MKSRNCIRVMVIMALAVAVGANCFAAASKTINVTAAVPTVAGSFTVTISKVRASDNQFVDSGPNLPIAFGTLSVDTTNNIYKADYYYAVDVGVVDNTSTAWTVTHTRTSLQKDSSTNLNMNVNVTFMKQTSSTTGTQLDKVVYNASNSKSFTKAQLSGGWLRVYYGIATGKGDAPNAVPIPLSQTAGTYSGTVTLSLAP